MLILLAALGGGVVTIFLGGDYTSSRWSNSQGDMAQRQYHWQQSLSLLRTPGDWLFGRGAERSPDSYALSVIDGQIPGDYRLLAINADHHLVLTGGRHVMGWGELFRFSQRIAMPAGTVDATATVKAARTVELHFEICEKHLLYNADCMAGGINVVPGDGGWQTLKVRLGGRLLSSGPWPAPGPAVFSVAVGNADGHVEIASLDAVDHTGRRLLADGNFSQGTARWFFSSDRSHLPWHAKNLLLGVLVDQGAFGVLGFAVLVLTASWRVSFGAARRHALAPALAGAIIGFLTVGAFDTLFDAPRVGLLFYLLTVIALCLPGQGSAWRMNAARTGQVHRRDPYP